MSSRNVTFAEEDSTEVISPDDGNLSAYIYAAAATDHVTKVDGVGGEVTLDLGLFGQAPMSHTETRSVQRVTKVIQIGEYTTTTDPETPAVANHTGGGGSRGNPAWLADSADSDSDTYHDAVDSEDDPDLDETFTFDTNAGYVVKEKDKYRGSSPWLPDPPGPLIRTGSITLRSAGSFRSPDSPKSPSLSSLRRRMSSRDAKDYYNLCWKDIRGKEKDQDDQYWYGPHYGTNKRPVSMATVYRVGGGPYCCHRNGKIKSTMVITTL